MKFIDVPKFRVRPNPNRFLVDKIFMLLSIGIVLYAMVYADYYLLDLTVPIFVNLMIIIGIVLLLALELIVSYVRYNRYSYDFHEHRLVINGKRSRSIDYSFIRHISYSTNLFDKWMHTGSIIVEMKDGKRVKLKYISYPNQAFFQLQKTMGTMGL